ncbi:hypothetical protein K470DRAFT_257289 [Piedraia hortae CBS 480.64]|uniref:Uncharacterized protein n=1 Tax=Piedraia hortae CBS 480.64 TaxID=1314780 RepID=A0A6A7C101_9PEZI|nr:hypothetical protein K470DRAFT_257289 [Piedraia hortae CBS 480.64]
MHQRNKNNLRHDPEDCRCLHETDPGIVSADPKILARQATTQAASTANPAPSWNTNAQALYNDSFEFCMNVDDQADVGMKSRCYQCTMPLRDTSYTSSCTLGFVLTEVSLRVMSHATW